MFTVCIPTDPDHDEHHEHHAESVQHLWDEWSAHGVYFYAWIHWLINKTQKLMMERVH